MTPELQKKIEEILAQSRWMRFDLSYTRGRWCALFAHERGAVYAKSWRTFPGDAIEEACAVAGKATKHLRSGER